MNNSRIKNSKRNILSSSINLLINLSLTFINRTIIIYTLGLEYTGLSSLFSSILQVLSLVEFGFSSVIVYYLYNPIAKNDIKEINVIMTWMQIVYRIIGGIIVVCGVITTPFLSLLIRGSYPQDINIYMLFLIYLMNTGISYFLFAYKEVILLADQKKYIINNVYSGIKIGVNILQFISLLFFRNYYLYVIVLIIGTVITNLYINHVTNQLYPYLKTEKKFEFELSHSIKKELVGMMINRLSNVSRNTFDNMIISSTLGLIATAIYSNYYMIYTVAISITNVFCVSIQASVGNSIVEKSESENFENLLDLSFLFSWIVAWCAISMACLYQPFMRLWIGEKKMLSNMNMLLFVVYFYLINMTHIRNQYIYGNALWWKLKWIYLGEAFGNFILNIVLGNFFGISGVLIATIVTIFFCNYLMCNYVLFKNYFVEESIWLFYRQQFYYMIVASVVGGIVYFICIDIESIIIKILVCVIVPNLLIVVSYFPCSRWKSSMSLIKRIIESK